MTSIVKICGLSTPETLDAALNAGADWVGFVFFEKSPRNVTFHQSRELLKRVEKRARTVALLVEPSDYDIDTLAFEAFDFLQLHGDETPERLFDIKSKFDNVPIMKALGVGSSEDLEAVGRYHDVADYLMLDAKPPRRSDALPGGNGVAFDWRLLAGLDPGLPFMLSGGLNPDNVAAAIGLTGARAVDVSSGVETRPGEKDPARIEAFVKSARAAFAAPQNKDKVA